MCAHVCNRACYSPVNLSAGCSAFDGDDRGALPSAMNAIAEVHHDGPDSMVFTLPPSDRDMNR